MCPRSEGAAIGLVKRTSIAASSYFAAGRSRPPGAMPAVLCKPPSPPSSTPTQQQNVSLLTPSLAPARIRPHQLPFPFPPHSPPLPNPMTRKGGNLVTGTGWGCRSCPRSCPVFPCPRQPYLRARLSTVSLASLLLWPHFPFLGLHLALVTLQRYSPNVYKTPQAFEF